MPINNGDTSQETLDEAKQAIETGKNIAHAPQNIQKGVSTAKKAVNLAKSAPAAIKKAATAAKAAKNMGYIIAFFTTPPVIAKLIVVGLIILGLLIGSLLNALNPFSTTNSPGGDNAEAQEIDIGEDRGVDIDSVDDELMLNYPMDDEEDKDGNKVTGQYSRMASLLYAGINEAYGRSVSKYATEKANYANDPQYKTHDNVNKVYIWPDGSEHFDDDYHNAANSSGIGASHKYTKKSDKPTLGEVPELEGDTWDDNDYLTDQSQGGAVQQGIAYIIAAYSVSRGNTAPVAVEGGKNKYTYYNGLKALLKKDNVLDGFFEYTGDLNKTEKTSTVKVVTLKHEKKVGSDGNNLICPHCYKAPSSADDVDNRDAKCTFLRWDTDYDYGSWYDTGYPQTGYVHGTSTYIAGYENSTTQYVTRTCSSTHATLGTNEYCWKQQKRTATPKYSCVYKCPKCNREIKSNYYQDYNKASQETRNKLKPAEYTYWVWVEGPSTNTDFKYVENSYKGNIAQFNDQAILEAMFLDDNDFYKDVQGKMSVGAYMGGAASITAGESITLPPGLGGVFTYMGWQMITSPSSNQYKLREAAGMNFNEEGFGIINGRYVIACTTTYGNVGDYVDFYQSNGNVLNCIIGDIKNQSDAGCNQWGHLNGQCVVEFVVDKNSWYNRKNNVGTSTNHPELGGQTIVKAVNGGNYFTNPNFVKDLKDTGETKEGKTPDSSDKQLAVANLAVQSLTSNKSTQPATSGWCAGWVSGIYEAAGLGYPGGNACDMWHNWKTAESTDVSKIPIGAIVYGGGTGTQYGHVGIYVGDTDGDGEGEVIDNWGGVRRSSVSTWSSGQKAHVDSYGESHPAGLLGWVWPNKSPLGDGYEFTGIDTSNLAFAGANVNPSTLTRNQRLQNILASDYYQWGVYYKYTCDHEKSKETKCPECGADIKIKKEKFLFFTTNRVPDFEYVKNEFPDFLGKLREDAGEDESMMDESDVYTVKEKIEYYQKDILDSITIAKQYESNTAGGPAGNGGVNPGVGAGNVGGNVGYSGNGSADAAPYMFTNPQNKREEMVNFALSFVGQPYVWGGKDPHTGADCSGFVAYVLNHFGYSATSYTGALVNEGVGISYSDIKPGDIILYTPGNNHHVAMYIGNGRIVHASNSAPYPSGGIKITGNALYEAPLAIRRFIQD